MIEANLQSLRYPTAMDYVGENIMHQTVTTETLQQQTHAAEAFAYHTGEQSDDAPYHHYVFTPQTLTEQSDLLRQIGTLLTMQSPERLRYLMKYKFPHTPDQIADLEKRRKAEQSQTRYKNVLIGDFMKLYLLDSEVAAVVVVYDAKGDLGVVASAKYSDKLHTDVQTRTIRFERTMSLPEEPLALFASEALTDACFAIPNVQTVTSYVDNTNYASHKLAVAKMRRYAERGYRTIIETGRRRSYDPDDGDYVGNPFLEHEGKTKYQIAQQTLCVA
jgi:hypothetical protein